MSQFFKNPVAILLLLFMGWSAFSSGEFSDPKTWLMSKLLILPGIIIGLSFHEFGHAAVAYKLGDNTPKFQGRLTVNPMAHIDPIGFIALLLVGFGWGRPVEIDPRVFKKPRRDELLVSVAGVIMNLILAVLFAIALGIFIRATGYYPNMGNMGEMISLMLYYCIYINLVLMVFNLLPIPPLDGFNVVTELFDLRRYDWWYKLYAYGDILLIALIAFNYTGRIMTPILFKLMTLIENIFLPF